MRKLILSLLILALSACGSQSQSKEPAEPSIPEDVTLSEEEKTETDPKEQQDEKDPQESTQRHESGLLGQLQNLSSSSSSAEVTLVLDSLVEQARDYYNQGLDVRSYAYDRKPVQSADQIVEQSFQINSFYSSWIDSLSLYEISRYENIQPQSTDNTVMLTRINNQFNTEVLCSVTGTDSNSLSLRFDRLTQAPSGIQGKYDENRYLQMLENRQYQYVLKAIETYFPLGVTWTPDLFDFDLSKDEAGYILTIEIRDPSNYNIAMGSYGLDGKSIVQDIAVDGFSVESGQIKVFLDPRGIIENIDSSIKSTVFVGSRSFEVSEKQQLYLSAADALDKQELLGVFEQINTGALGQGSDFVLQISEMESES